MPLATPPPSKKIQEFVASASGGPPGEIDLMMLYLQGSQINTRMTQAEQQAKEQNENHAERDQKIIEEQARASVWRMTTSGTIEDLVVRFAASEQARKRGAKWYRRAIVMSLSVAILALIVGCAALAVVLS